MKTNLSDAAIVALISQIEPVQEVRETAISKVFLTETYVFKLKKTIKLPFIDLSDLEKRFKFVQAEIELNRRLCRQIYLGYSLIETANSGYTWSPLSSTSGTFREEHSLDNAAEVILVMRRLNTEYCLDRLIESGNYSHLLLKPIVKTLLPFYKANLHENSTPEELRTSLRKSFEGNFSVLEKYFKDKPDSTFADIISHLKDYSFCFLKKSIELLADRSKFVADCHGDLKPEHICFDPAYPSPQIFDCLEFSDSLRRIDILNDFAFLLMELEFLGRFDISAYFTGILKSDWPDLHCDACLKFYKIYRALVRAKVLLLKSQQEDAPVRSSESVRAELYIGLASRYMQGLIQPILILICGHMGCGKSTLASELNKYLGFKILRTDTIRRELLHGDRSAKYGEGEYSRDKRLRVYKEMMARADTLLARGSPVILDGNFPYRSLRTEAIGLAEKHKSAHVVMFCSLKEELIRQRLREREKSLTQKESDARESLLLGQIVDYQKVTSRETKNLLSINMEKSPSVNARLALDYLTGGNI